jgi:2-C-methyl-D-erythritol 4-phosphate cytidylyltransferase
MNKFALILPAAGASTRFGSPRGKLLEDLAGQTVLARSLSAFVQRADVAFIVVAASAGIRPHVPSSPRLTVCDGGTCRAGSVLNALRKVPAEIEWVAVHDAARPLVSAGLIDHTFAAAMKHGAAAPALPVVQTLRRAASPLPAASGGVVPRDGLFAMQTPQFARRGELLEAFERCPIPLEQITDDVQALELAGHSVWLVPGEESNLKLTTPGDLLVARALFSQSGRTW